MSKLIIKDLHVNVENQEILHGINLELELDKTNVIMGPNGHGKSTLMSAIMGHPNYQITKGSISFNGIDITDLEVDERARLGLFMSMQYPAEIPGVNNVEFLRAATKNVRSDLNLFKFAMQLDEEIEFLNMKESLKDRDLNEGFSGGEKKKNEILQMLMLQPKFSLIDEVDSGLDIDSLKYVSAGINKMKETGSGNLIITHYNRILEYVKPDNVFVLMNGQIKANGGHELVNRLEEEGYGWIK